MQRLLTSLNELAAILGERIEAIGLLDQTPGQEVGSADVPAASSFPMSGDGDIAFDSTMDASPKKSPARGDVAPQHCPIGR